MSDRSSTPPLSAFPVTLTERFRYCDTDRQGHINNVVFAALLESGRVMMMHDRLDVLEGGGTQIVIASLSMQFLAEMHWPGEAIVATGISRLGNSSITLRQAIYHEGKCAATADSVIVLIDTRTRRATPLTPALREVCKPLML